MDPLGAMDEGGSIFGNDADEGIEYVAGEIYEYAIEKNPLWIGNWGIW